MNLRGSGNAQAMVAREHSRSRINLSRTTRMTMAATVVGVETLQRPRSCLGSLHGGADSAVVFFLLGTPGVIISLLTLKDHRNLQG